MSESTDVTVYEGQDEVQKEIQPIVARATQVTISDQASRNAAIELGKEIVSGRKKVTEFFKPLKQAQDRAKKAILDREKELLEPLQQAEDAVKRTIIAFDRAQEEIRRKEQARLQAEADAKAAAERERALKAAEKLKTDDLREQRIAEAETIVAPTVVVAPAVVKSKGEATVKRWKARVVNFKQLVIVAAQGNPMALALLEFNQTAANKQATATKDNLIIPGVEFYAEESLALRT